MRRAATILFALLAMPVPASAFTANALLGRWFGTGQPEDKSRMYIDNFLAGGVFRGEHRLCLKGKAYDSGQTGHWTVNGDRLTVHIETEDNGVAPRDDLYRIVSLDAKTHKYIYLPMNFPYTAHKVEAGFVMPPCDLTS